MRCRCLTGLRMPSSISREKMAAMSSLSLRKPTRISPGCPHDNPSRNLLCWPGATTRIAAHATSGGTGC